LLLLLAVQPSISAESTKSGEVFVLTSLQKVLSMLRNTRSEFHAPWLASGRSLAGMPNYELQANDCSAHIRDPPDMNDLIFLSLPCSFDDNKKILSCMHQLRFKNLLLMCKVSKALCGGHKLMNPDTNYSQLKIKVQEEASLRNRLNECRY
jgi:hypothetical protein